MKSEMIKVLEVDATDLFADDSDDWKYCIEYAPFQHREACEFMLYVDYKKEEFDALYGDCSKELLALLKSAKEQGAAWLLLYA